MEKRYEKNLGTFSEIELQKLRNAKVFIAGCGGSGYIIDELIRLGVEYIGVADGDIFEESNLNRQMLCNMSSIGRKKVIVAYEYAKNINPQIDFQIYPFYLNDDNIDSIICKYDIVLECVDNIESKILIYRTCTKFNIPFVFGGMSKWIGQVGVSLGKNNIAEKIYGVNKQEKNNEPQMASTTSFINAFTSSLYVLFCVKILTEQYFESGKLYIYDLYGMKIAHISSPKQKFLLFRKW